MKQMKLAPQIGARERDHFGHNARRQWLLDDACVFLNHGSFGATPREVLSAQDDWRARMERQPVHFFTGVLPGALRQASDELGDFMGTSGRNLAFVENATTAANAVLRSLRCGPSDEILFTNHGYGAVNKAVDFVCRRTGAQPVKDRVPFPASDDDVVAVVREALSPRARLAVLDHVTSPTAQVFPVKRLVEICHERGVKVLIDGAHAPGMLDLNIDVIGADYYAGNCHKWLFAPKGCGFLQAAPSAQVDLHPAVISWGWPDGFIDEFDWAGTRDPSAFLAVSAALQFFFRLPPQRRREYNNELASWAAWRMRQAWSVALPALPTLPVHMATVPLPGNLPGTREAGDHLHDALLERHNVEVPIIDFAGKLWVRVSAQVYNEPSDYERLIEAVKAELGDRQFH